MSLGTYVIGFMYENKLWQIITYGDDFIKVKVYITQILKRESTHNLNTH